MKKNSALFPRNAVCSTIGTEIISPILNIENSMGEIIKVLKFIASSGEPEFGYRSSIHVHVSFPIVRLKTLKNIIRLAANYEVLAYYIGGMGYKFRGEKNDSIYCRPITLWGPACIKINKQAAQIFTIKSLLAAKTINEFWENYGDTYRHNSRYNNPARYCWINLLPLFKKKEENRTLEFRIFNKTLNPEYIMAAIKWCLEFAKMADNSLKRIALNERSIFSYGKETALKLADEFCSLSGNLDYERKILYSIIKRTREINLKKGYVFTHKRGLEPFWERGNYLPDLIDTENVRYPQYVDIHILRGERG